MTRTLSPKELADVVGVSESSLKRWADAGRLNVTRTAGGHRRIALHAAIRFIRETRLPVVRPDILGLGDLPAALPETSGSESPSVELLLKCVASGDESTFLSTIMSQFMGGQRIAAIFDGPISIVLRHVGELWSHGEHGIAIEHRTSGWCTASLNLLRTHLQAPSAGTETDPRPRALGACVPGDLHHLPSLAAQAVLTEVGWNAHNFSADLPYSALVSTARDLRPKLVWLSASAPPSATSLAGHELLSDSLRKHSIPLVIGGAGAESLAAALGLARVHVARTMADLEAAARATCPTP